jgi:hypothetical protein
MDGCDLPRKKNRPNGTGLSAVDVEQIREWIKETMRNRPATRKDMLIDDLKDLYPHGKWMEFNRLIQMTVNMRSKRNKTIVNKGSVITIYSLVCDCGKVHKIISEKF